jgi:NADH dehydrogenase
MATISRFADMASVGRFRFSGFIAWLIWLTDLLYLIGFKSASPGAALDDQLR